LEISAFSIAFEHFEKLGTLYLDKCQLPIIIDAKVLKIQLSNRHDKFIGGSISVTGWKKKEVLHERETLLLRGRKEKISEEDFYPAVHIPHVPIDYDLPEDKRGVKNQTKKYYEIIRMVKRRRREYGEEKIIEFPEDVKQKIIKEIEKQRPPVWHK
jgi:hypothetical protein